MNEQQEKKIEYNPDFWNIGGKKSRKNTGKKKTKEENSNNLPNDNLSNDDLPNDNFINQLSQLTNIMQNNNTSTPNWGNLKDGKLPTYRTYYNINNKNNNNNEKNNQTIESVNTYSNSEPIKEPYMLGKNKKNRTTKIRIQGKKSRRKIKKYIRELDQQSLTDIKNDLYNNCLIKCGTNTPSDVLKEMYKASKLSGGIKNKNSEILLHNFYSTEEKDD